MAAEESGTPIAFPILNPETQTGVRKKYEHSHYALTVVKNDDTLKLEFIWKGDGQKFSRLITNKDISDISTGELFSSMNDIDYLEKLFYSIHQPNFINSPNLSYHYLVESNTFRITISQKIQNLAMGTELVFGFEIIIPEIGEPDSQWVLQTKAQEIIDKTKYLSIDVEPYFNQLMFTQEPEEIVRIGKIILNIQELNGQNWSRFKNKFSSENCQKVYKSLILAVFMLITKWYQDERIMTILLKVSTNMTDKDSRVEINFRLLIPILEHYKDNLEMKINLLSFLNTTGNLVCFTLDCSTSGPDEKILEKLMEELNSDNILVISQFLNKLSGGYKGPLSANQQSSGQMHTFKQKWTRLLRPYVNFCCEETNNFLLILNLITESFLMFDSGLLHASRVSQWLQEVISKYAHSYHLLIRIKLELPGKASENNLMTVNALLDKFQQ